MSFYNHTSVSTVWGPTNCFFLAGLPLNDLRNEGKKTRGLRLFNPKLSQKYSLIPPYWWSLFWVWELSTALVLTWALWCSTQVVTLEGGHVLHCVLLLQWRWLDQTRTRSLKKKWGGGGGALQGPIRPPGLLRGSQTQLSFSISALSINALLMPLPLSLFLSCHSLFLPFPFHISCLFLSFSSMPLSPLVSPSLCHSGIWLPTACSPTCFIRSCKSSGSQTGEKKEVGQSLRSFPKSLYVSSLWAPQCMKHTWPHIWDIQQHCSTYTGLQVNLQLCEELGRHRPLSSRWLAQIHHHIKQHISEPAARPDCVKAFNPSDLGQGGKCCRLIELASFWILAVF